MSDPRSVTVGDVVAAFLEQCGVRAAFGVISIHNMPILDAFGRRGAIRFVPARSESGATNMADAFARVSGGLGVTVSSTGTGAGNTCGAMVEALTAGTPLIHLTGQIDTPYLDRDMGFIHEARDQLAMLKSVSKAAFRVMSPETALGTLKEAVNVALTAPMGPVSVEIPIDIQSAPIEMPADLSPLLVPVVAPLESSLDVLASHLERAKRPMLWLGGGTRRASMAARRLADLGFGIATSVQGRGVVPERHPMNLGAFNMQPPIERFYGTCDAMLVVGSRLRSNETLKYKLKLPRPLYRIDADPRQEGRAYGTDAFIAGDAELALEGLVERLEDRMKIDPAFGTDLRGARELAERQLLDMLGPYAQLVRALEALDDLVWVRDVTISNSTWGNRLPRLRGPLDGVHALGGGIGQGIQMALGASLAAPDRKVVCLTGDGGLQVNIGELATLVQEKANVAMIVMNDRGYGVIRNIQDAQFGGRRYYVDLHTPDFALLAGSLGLPFHRVADLAKLEMPLREAISARGPVMLEIDMQAVGPFAETYAGPPDKKAEPRAVA